jgi:hypothetical protein
MRRPRSARVATPEPGTWAAAPRQPLAGWIEGDRASWLTSRTALNRYLENA